jgi:AraC-like DNA-binding protein
MAVQGAFELRRPDAPSQRIDEGCFVIERRDRDWATRIEGRSVMLLMEWSDDVFGRAEPESGGVLGARTLARLRGALAPFVAGVSDRRALEGARSTLAILRAEGVPLPPFSAVELNEPVPTAHAALARAVDRAVADFVRSPRSADLEDELGWSSRHVTRRLSELHQRYGFNATGGVRDVLGRWRIYAGTALMTAPATTTEAVARLMGYASSPSFCKAFARHGLPSPGNVREALRSIG